MFKVRLLNLILAKLYFFQLIIIDLNKKENKKIYYFLGFNN